MNAYIEKKRKKKNQKKNQFCFSLKHYPPKCRSGISSLNSSVRLRTNCRNSRHRLRVTSTSPPVTGRSWTGTSPISSLPMPLPCITSPLNTGIKMMILSSQAAILQVCSVEELVLFILYVYTHGYIHSSMCPSTPHIHPFIHSSFQLCIHSVSQSVSTCIYTTIYDHLIKICVFFQFGMDTHVFQ